MTHVGSRARVWNRLNLLQGFSGCQIELVVRYYREAIRRIACTSSFDLSQHGHWQDVHSGSGGHGQQGVRMFVD